MTPSFYGIAGKKTLVLLQSKYYSYSWYFQLPIYEFTVFPLSESKVFSPRWKYAQIWRPNLLNIWTFSWACWLNLEEGLLHRFSWSVMSGSCSLWTYCLISAPGQWAVCGKGFFCYPTLWKSSPLCTGVNTHVYCILSMMSSASKQQRVSQVSIPPPPPWEINAVSCTFVLKEWHPSVWLLSLMD